jgi:hypothetical protein
MTHAAAGYGFFAGADRNHISSQLKFQPSWLDNYYMEGIVYSYMKVKEYQCRISG